MKKWMLLLILFLFVPLSACGGGEDDTYFRGQVAEVQQGEDGLPSALILDTGGGESEGVFLDGDTQVASAVPEVSGEEFGAQPVLGTWVSVYLRPDAEPRPLTARDGTQFPKAGTADFLTVEEAKLPAPLRLSDGTVVEVWADGWRDRVYRLPDGTELLRESPPETDFSTYRVDGSTPLSELSPALLEGVAAYYRERGALYDLQAEVERAYAAYLQAPEDFQRYLAEQEVSWTSTAPGVYYFLTTLNLSVEPRIITQVQFTDAFDRETGAHIPNEDLFTAEKEEVLDVLIAQMDVDETLERELRENFQWTYLIFWPDGPDVFYPAGSLPSQEHTWGWGVDYSALSQILQPWAVPQAANQ